jgi:hypothetical protein
MRVAALGTNLLLFVVFFLWASYFVPNGQATARFDLRCVWHPRGDTTKPARILNSTDRARCRARTEDKFPSGETGTTHGGTYRTPLIFQRTRVGRAAAGSAALLGSGWRADARRWRACLLLRLPA